MEWKSAGSGNPLNKRLAAKVNMYRNLCQQFTEEAVAIMQSIVRNELVDPAIRLNGCHRLMESGWGKAPQSVEVKTNDSVLPELMTQEQLMLAAAGQTQELVCSLIESGKLGDYAPGYEGVVPRRIEKDITEVKDDHLGAKPKEKRKKPVAAIAVASEVKPKKSNRKKESKSER
jgi:hypothetical protein